MDPEKKSIVWKQIGTYRIRRKRPVRAPPPPLRRGTETWSARRHRRRLGQMRRRQQARGWLWGGRGSIADGRIEFDENIKYMRDLFAWRKMVSKERKNNPELTSVKNTPHESRRFVH